MLDGWVYSIRQVANRALRCDLAVCYQRPIWYPEPRSDGVAVLDPDLGDQVAEQRLSGRGGPAGHDMADLGLQLVQ